MSGTPDDLLERVAATLLPAGDGLPGGDEVPLGAALSAEPGHERDARRALDALAGDEVPLDAALAALALEDPAAHQALLLVVSAGYYADPRVQAQLGYAGPASAALPPLPDARDAELEPLLERVRRRGPRYRETPPTSSTTSSHQRSSIARATSAPVDPSQP